MAPKTPPTKVPARAQNSNLNQHLNQHHKQWDQKVAQMNAAASAIDWSKVDFSKLNPADIGVQFGPPMTEEQFREYRKQRAGSVHVLGSQPATKKP